ncbi:MAG: hypothetical protein KatS3mg003_0169 [Candidatus Nitrosocaldaceae archaeon]|nr:MAG: hypothetical protein KatS3mg003_0169 [Candidatus Nitrosocaldaceae archaeon]
MRREILNAIALGSAVIAVILAVNLYFTSLPNEEVEFRSADEITDKSIYKKAPEISGISGYINTDKPLTLADLKDKVVLVDFWTYTCINCIRTIPYLNAWHEKYSDDGLVILGIHTPEFEFEKEYENVKAAVERYGIKYPVLQDNDYITWNAYANRYWPHKYLIDHEGYIRYDHIGEGAYEETENVIKELLRERAEALGLTLTFDEDIEPEAEDVNFNLIFTPELYLGYKFNTAIGNGNILIQDQVSEFSLPEECPVNKVCLEGLWRWNDENIELVSAEGKIVLRYSAKAVNIVASGNSLLTISLDNKPIDEEDYGDDVSDGTVIINEQRLYNLVKSGDYGKHMIEIHVEGKGFRLYTFTFG